MPIEVGFSLRVPRSKFHIEILVEDMTHQYLAFLSSPPKGSQVRWSTIDKVGYAIATSIRRLDYLV